jgi:hypothetical protein
MIFICFPFGGASPCKYKDIPELKPSVIKGKYMGGQEKMKGNKRTVTMTLVAFHGQETDICVPG